MSRDIGATWDPSRQVYGAWAGRVTTSKLLVGRTCLRCDTLIPGGHQAIAFAGTELSRTGFYHRGCAKALGIRPTS